MRRIFGITIACLAVVLCFNSCKLDTTEVTISVTNKENAPIADRAVYYTNKAALYEKLIAPEAVVTDEAVLRLDSVFTDPQGLIVKQVLANVTYVFCVRDNGTNEWAVQSAKAKKGETPTLEFVLNN